MARRYANVLLICVDHWPGQLLGCAAHPCIRTPTLDAIAANGVRFTNAYSECPVCIPARRSLMTGLSPHNHGLNANRQLEMPAGVVTLAETFRQHGYQAYGVGKLHVHPQRDRIGFDDVLLDEEGRMAGAGSADDYEMYLADAGHVGERFAGGMANNEYLWRPWHLAEHLHATNWAARSMARTIRRRDPQRPAFWYLSFSHPHPPLTPLADYLAMYDPAEIDDPVMGTWAGEAYSPAELREVRAIRRAFYALCTHIDHQIRMVLGTLREEGLHEDTILLFTSDHGDMLGNHRLWRKSQFYESSAKVPMLLVGPAGESRTPPGTTDDRLVCLADVLPTLADMAGLDVGPHVDGISMVADEPWEHLFGEFGGGDAGGSRMIRKGQHKLIYRPAGNRLQLFHTAADANDLQDVIHDPAHAAAKQDLLDTLVLELKRRGSDWLQGGELVGTPASDSEAPSAANRGLRGQRGLHWPPPNRPRR